MSTIITVPAELVGQLRVGLLSVLADAAEDILNAAKRRGRERHSEWFQGARGKFERAFVLLDLIDWSEPDRRQTA
jgi:hypothetical protein